MSEIVQESLGSARAYHKALMSHAPQSPASQVLLLVLHSEQSRQLQKTASTALCTLLLLGVRVILLFGQKWRRGGIIDHATIGTHHQGLLAVVCAHHLLNLSGDSV